MIKFNKLVFFSFTILLLTINSKSSKAADFELWTFVGVETGWNKMEFSLANANFFLPEGGWFLNFTQFSLDFKSKNNFSCGLAYKQEYVKLNENMRIEYRPMLHLYYKKSWGFIEFRDRNRLEFRIIEGQLVNRYRNQMQLSYTRFKGIVPYISTEFFVMVEQVDYARQRTLLGVNIPIKKASFNLFGGHQANEDAPQEWADRFMLGTALSFSF